MTASTDVVSALYQILKKRNLTLCTAESATGGLISHLITNMPSISEVYMGGICTYSNQAKEELLGVSQETLKEKGAVSQEVAQQMALGACRLFKADVSVCDTGIAGPNGQTETKPLGLFYIGVCVQKQTFVFEHIFNGTRLHIKNTAAEMALKLLKTALENC
ncbi:MAG: CinA family protein [Chloroflexi bacterium]|nr:CinA family protein [Chloroflexota bacterium]